MNDAERAARWRAARTPEQRQKIAADLRLYKAQWRLDGRCGRCGAPRDRADRRHCAACRTRPRTERQREYVRQRVQALRAAVLAGYGGRCQCCGESEPSFLALHHPNGDGKADRTSGGWSGTLYARLAREGFPPGYELWCHNCHLSMHQLGQCAHRGH